MTGSFSTSSFVGINSRSKGMMTKSNDKRIKLGVNSLVEEVEMSEEAKNARVRLRHCYAVIYDISVFKFISPSDAKWPLLI